MRSRARTRARTGPLKRSLVCVPSCGSPPSSSPAACSFDRRSCPCPPRPILPPRRMRPPRSTIRPSWRSRSTTRTSRSCATCAASSWRAGRPTCASWTSRRRSIRRPCTSDRSASRRASACSSRTTSTTCSSPTSCCGSTSAARSRWCATRQEAGSTRQEEVKARLLSYNSGPVWKIGDEIVTGIGADHIRFPELPDNLYTRPTLIWTLRTTGRRATASRRRTSPASCHGTPTTC